jgi:voltage-gated sodium channel
MWAFLFFFVFVMLGNYVLLSLFIGIIAAEMENAMRAQLETKQLASEVDSYCKKNKIKSSKKRAMLRAYRLMYEIRPSEGIDFEVIMLGLRLVRENVEEEDARKWFKSCAERPPGGELNMYDFVVFLTSMPWRDGEKMIQCSGDELISPELLKARQLQKDEEDDIRRKTLKQRNSVHALDKAIEEHPGSLKSRWAQFGKWNLNLTESPMYQNFMLGVVVVAGLTVAIQAGYEEFEHSKFLETFDLFIWSLFTMEVLQKMFSNPFAPWKYFTDRDTWMWNLFDFVVQVLSIPGVYPAAKALRIFRLARLIKLINKIPSLKVICTGLISGLGSVVYIFLLIAIIFYVYGVLGVVLFKENDPFHFPNIPIAFETLSRCATMEDWTDVWYINFYGCSFFTAIGGSSYMHTNDMSLVGTRQMIDGAAYTLCSSKAQPVLASLYFISFITIAAFILLSLFVGTILISTMDAVQEISDKKKETVKARRVEAKNRAQAMAMSLPMRRRKQIVLHNILVAWSNSNNKDIKKLGKEIKKALSKKLKTGEDGYVDDTVNLNWAEAKSIKNPLKKVYFMLSVYCAMVRDNWVFQTLVNLAIMAASIQVGVQAAGAEEASGLTQEHWRTADLALNGIFTCELVMKIVAEGFTPLHFFKDGWNRLDFVIVVCAYTPEIGGVALLFRMVRLLRVVKVVRVFPELRMLVAALLNAQDSIMFVSLLMFLVFFSFAIFTVMEFKENDKWRFGDLHTALLTLFRVATGDDWTDVMYTAQFGCKEYPTEDPSLCTDEGNSAKGWFAVVFFTLFHMLGGLVFLNLFIGVITVGMADAMEERDDEAYTQQRVRRLKMSEHSITSYMHSFEALDLTKDNRVDVHDIKWALETLLFAPSEQDVHNLIYSTFSSAKDDRDEPPESELDLYDFVHAMENHKAILLLPHTREKETTTQRTSLFGMMGMGLGGSKVDMVGDSTDKKKRSSPTSTAEADLAVAVVRATGQIRHEKKAMTRTIV